MRGGWQGPRSRSAFVIVLLLLVQRVCSLREEAEPLVQFQRQVIDRVGSLKEWNSSPDPCIKASNATSRKPWFGVECTNGAVTGLRLGLQNLAGTISPQICRLKNLEVLDLGGNYLTGDIPKNISELRSLRGLYLGGNALTGPVPDLPPNLQYVYLNDNQLRGNISQTNVFGLMSIVRLDLHSNRLTGRLPEHLNGTALCCHPSRKVAFLDLTSNLLDGPLPKDLGFAQVNVLKLGNNKFSGPLPEGPYSNVTAIDVGINELSGRIPPMLLSSSDRRGFVNLSANAFSGVIDFAGSRLWGTRFLDLSFNRLENEGDLRLGELMNSTLEFLVLNENNFSGSLDTLFKTRFPKLRELRLGGNNFRTGDLKQVLPNVHQMFLELQVMDLHASGLTGEISPVLFREQTLPRLKSLDLSCNALVGTIPSGLKQMVQLQELRLGGNRLGGRVNLDATWSSIEILDLRDNDFGYDGAALHSFLNGSFPELRELRLGGRNPTAAILPSDIGQLVFLEILDLTRCNLVGNIPVNLTRTDLLPNLKSLLLAENSLEGPLPAGLGRMPELAHLNVSHNRLSGELPQFDYRFFSDGSFEGNRALCGPPLGSCHEKPSAKARKVVIVVSCAVVVSSSSCLLVGWVWRRKLDAKRHAKDAELIASLLDRDLTTLMPLRKLRKATNDFAEENVIGVGGFGAVYRGVLEDGTEVAIKRSRQKGSSSEDMCQFLNEVKILSQVRHRNLVRLLGCCLNNSNALLVYEFIPNGTLEEHLHGKLGFGPGPEPLTWTQRLTIAIQTANALDYLHSSAAPPIYHLDVKSANILLDSSLNAKVSDFGISKLAPTPNATHITTLQGLQGTFGYMDPELVLKSTLTDKSDVYAFGVVLLELLTAKPVLDPSRGDHASLVKWILPLLEAGRLEDVVDPSMAETFETPEGFEGIHAVAEIALRCLTFRSEDRPTMRDVSVELLNCHPDRSSYTCPRTPKLASFTNGMIQMSSFVNAGTV